MIRKLKSAVIAAITLIAGAFTASAEEPLPTGFLQIDYIESTGSQYINTGYKAKSNTRIEAHFNTGSRSGIWSAFFGALKNDDSKTGLQLRYYNSRNTLNGYFFGDGVTTTDDMAGKDVTVTLKSGLLKINNSEFKLNTVGGDPCDSELFIFAQNDVHTDGKTDDGGIRCQAFKLYWFKIYEDETPVRDFVPCRTPWNEIGLYDRIEKKFYGNSGSGAFVAPPDVPPPSREVTLPEGYAKLDWIESSGTQHIDTQYVPKRTTQVAASFKALTRKEIWAAFFGVMNNDKTDNGIGLRYYDNTHNINGLFCNTKYDEAKTSGTYENVEVMAAVRDGAMVINGTVHKISTSADPYDNSLILFGERNGNEIRRRQAMRLYWLTIYEGTTVVHDYVPCRRKSDGARGLYDLRAPTDQAFKPNDGTGVFTGPDITAYAKLDGDGYAYYDAGHDRVGAPETGIKGLPLAFANGAEYLALVAAPERVAEAAGVILEKDAMLTSDEVWTALDFDIGENTIDLNGHKLTVNTLTGKGEVTDTSGAGNGELHVNVPEGATVSTGSMRITGSVLFVKGGKGTLGWSGGANSVATSASVSVTDGLFKFNTDDNDVFGNGGDIYISGTGQMDISKKSKNGINDVSPVYNRTFHIAGDGPDGTGAIVRNAENGGYNSHLKTVYLTGDATIGGASRIDLRGDNALIRGEGFTLTIKGKSLCLENRASVKLAVRRIVVTEGGNFAPNGAPQPVLEVPGGIELTRGGRLMPWMSSSSGTYTLAVPVTVGEGGGAIGTEQGSLVLTEKTTVRDNGTAIVSQTVTFTDLEVQAGATLDATGTANIAGALSGNGTVKGANAKFGGDATRWVLAADGEGWTSKAVLTDVNENVLAALKEIDVTYTGLNNAELEICPTFGLTDTTLPKLDVRTADGTSVPGGLEIRNESLFLVIRVDSVAVATWTGNGGDGNPANPANWACVNALGAPLVDKLPIADSIVRFNGGELPDIPSGASFAAKVVVLSGALDRNCDWRGLNAPLSGKLDLNGHKLQVPRLESTDLEGFEPAEITDTCGTDYQLLSHLQSDGTAYINTGYKANKNTRIEANFNTGTRSGNWSAFFGATKDNKGILLRYYQNRSTLHCFFFGGDKETDAMSGKDVTVTLKDGLLKINDKSYEFTTGDVSCDYEMYIFAQNNGGKVDAKQAYKLYSFKVYEGETLVHDFAPARRLSDGELGLLDLAQEGESFYANVNQGGGSFTAGDAVGMRHYGAACGELHVNVASGEVENTDVALTGSLKLVKEGAGTFVAAKTGQTYFGGTEVAGGQFALWNSGKDHTDWMPSTHGTLGALGSTIDVDSGARFNIVGNYDLFYFNIRLNGGQFESNNRPGDTSTSFAQTREDWAGSGDIALTTDSKYLVGFDILQNRRTVDLGGHSLDIEFTNGTTLRWGSGIQNGTLVVRNSDTTATGASWFKTIAAVDARTVTFDMYEQFALANDLSVSNYVSHSPDNLENGHSGSAALNVYGAFAPVTDFFYGCTMQDGSTLDLSTRTGAWSTTSKSPTGKTTVEFVPGTTVYIDLGARHDSGDKGKIVSWTAKPEGVTFKLAPTTQSKGRIRVEDDGIYIKRGLIITIL